MPRIKLSDSQAEALLAQGGQRSRISFASGALTNPCYEIWTPFFIRINNYVELAYFSTLVVLTMEDILEMGEGCIFDA